MRHARIIDLIYGSASEGDITAKAQLDKLEAEGYVRVHHVISDPRENCPCRTKLLSGTVFHPGTEMLRKSDMRYGYIHPCVTYPISDISLLI